MDARPRPAPSLRMRGRAIARRLATVVVAVVVGVWLSATPAAAGGSAETRPEASMSAPRVADATWAWPIAAPFVVTRDYVLTGPYDPGHRGIDLAAAPGSPVRAPADGTVRFAGVVVDRPVLSIEHDDGTVSSFEPVVASVAAGDRVGRGDVVATVSADVHHAPSGGLHLGARVDGEYRNPLLFLGGVPPAVLLPPRGG